MSPHLKLPESLQDYLRDQSCEETVKVLDEVLSILVIHTEYAGLSERLVHQYLTVRNLREAFNSIKN